MNINESKIIITGYIIFLAVGIPLVFGMEWVAEKRGVKNLTVGGIHDVMLHETAIIEDINRTKRQITVKMHNQDNIYVEEGDENPYDKDKVVLEYSEKKEFYVSELKVSDEIVFRHFYDTPYEIESIKRVDNVWIPEAAIIEDINRAERQITVKMFDQDNIYIERKKENPYAKEKVILEYSEDKTFYVSELEVSDEVVFRHFYETPYKIESIEKKE